MPKAARTSRFYSLDDSSDKATCVDPLNCTWDGVEMPMFFPEDPIELPSRPMNRHPSTSSSGYQNFWGSPEGNLYTYSVRRPSSPPVQMVLNMTEKEKRSYMQASNFKHCAAVETKYEMITRIGEGTYGEVFKAYNKKDKKQFVAIKRIIMGPNDEGVPITALREIKLLQLLKHDNIVNLIEVCTIKASQSDYLRPKFGLIFEFCEHDLAGLLYSGNVPFRLGEIKKLMQMMFNGLYYIHSNNVLHRDLKPPNILVTKDGVLKIADFGLARNLSRRPGARYTNNVVTLWYRPPELLLDSRTYTASLDMWGAGCIMAEMWLRRPIMQGESEREQLLKIINTCGSIDADSWPEVDFFYIYNKVELVQNVRRRLREILSPQVKDPVGLDLIDRLLVLNPQKRATADEALNHDFFWSDPMPCDLKATLSKLRTSNFESTTMNEKKKIPIKPFEGSFPDLIY